MKRLPTVAVVGLLAVAVALLAAPAGAGSPFTAADAALRTRVAGDGLTGGVLLVADGDTTLHRFTTGTLRPGELSSRSRRRASGSPRRPS